MESLDQVFASHTFIKEKLIPEIELHFELLKNDSLNDLPLFIYAFQLFNEIKTELFLHFLKEETILFQYLKKANNSNEFTHREIKNQLLNEHDSEEGQIIILIDFLQIILKSNVSFFSLRILINKLDTLHSTLLEHKIQEEEFFKILLEVELIPTKKSSQI